MSTRDDVVAIAKGEVGKPYGTHRDCSGFTAWAFRQVGVTLPEGSVAQYGVGHGVPSRDLQPGDLVFWSPYGNTLGHVALAISSSEVVHALNPGRGIIVSNIHADMGGPMVGARRVLPDASPGGTPNPKPDRERREHRERKRARRRQRLMERLNRIAP